MTKRQMQLLEQIEIAFRGVELGRGVSLHEADVLDNYGSDAERSVARAQDEKHDWRKLIDAPDLFRWALSFFDDAGMRFHLPAYLSAAVKDPGGFGPVGSLLFHLTNRENFNPRRFALLDSQQRFAVWSVLVFLRDESIRAEDWDFDKENGADEAIDGYWSHPV